MRIVNAPTGDPMLMDTASGLRALSDSLNAFLASASPTVVFEADTGGGPAPYDELLLGLRVAKGSGKQLTISDDRWLQLDASPQELRALSTLLRQLTGGAHGHWHSAPVSLIIDEGDPWNEA
jgi:hypothetical protein